MNTISKKRDELSALIMRHCGTLDFTYGSGTASTGDFDCRLFLGITETERRLYVGQVCTPHRIRNESQGIGFVVMNNHDDVIAFGLLTSGGQFSFPFHSSMDGTECHLQLANVAIARRPAIIPPAIRRCDRPQHFTEGRAADRITDSDTSGPICIVGHQIHVSLPVEGIPFGILAVASIDSRGNLHKVHVVLAEPDDARLEATAVFDASWICDDDDPNKYIIDAWPVTADPATRLAISSNRLQQFAASSSSAATAVQRLQEAIALELEGPASEEDADSE